jgi:hypothetical protein
VKASLGPQKNVTNVQFNGTRDDDEDDDEVVDGQVKEDSSAKISIAKT